MGTPRSGPGQLVAKATAALNAASGADGSATGTNGSSGARKAPVWSTGLSVRPETAPKRSRIIAASPVRPIDRTAVISRSRTGSSTPSSSASEAASCTSSTGGAAAAGALNAGSSKGGAANSSGAVVKASAPADAGPAVITTRVRDRIRAILRPHTAAAAASSVRAANSRVARNASPKATASGGGSGSGSAPSSATGSPARVRPSGPFGGLRRPATTTAAIAAGISPAVAAAQVRLGLRASTAATTRSSRPVVERVSNPLFEPSPPMLLPSEDLSMYLPPGASHGGRSSSGSAASGKATAAAAARAKRLESGGAVDGACQTDDALLRALWLLRPTADGACQTDPLSLPNSDHSMGAEAADVIGVGAEALATAPAHKAAALANKTGGANKEAGAHKAAAPAAISSVDASTATTMVATAAVSVGTEPASYPGETHAATGTAGAAAASKVKSRAKAASKAASSVAYKQSHAEEEQDDEEEEGDAEELCSLVELRRLISEHAAALPSTAPGDAPEVRAAIDAMRSFGERAMSLLRRAAAVRRSSAGGASATASAGTASEVAEVEAEVEETLAVLREVAAFARRSSVTAAASVGGAEAAAGVALVAPHLAGSRGVTPPPQSHATIAPQRQPGGSQRDSGAGLPPPQLDLSSLAPAAADLKPHAGPVGEGVEEAGELAGDEEGAPASEEEGWAGEGEELGDEDTEDDASEGTLFEATPDTPGTAAKRSYADVLLQNMSVASAQRSTHRIVRRRSGGSGSRSGHQHRGLRVQGNRASVRYLEVQQQYQHAAQRRRH